MEKKIQSKGNLGKLGCVFSCDRAGSDAMVASPFPLCGHEALIEDMHDKRRSIHITVTRL